MKKVLPIITFTLLLALTVGLVAYAAPTLTTGRIKVGSRVYNTPMIINGRVVYVDCNRLGSIMRMPVRNAKGSSVYFRNTLVNGIIQYKGVKYVNAAAFANKMGYRVSMQSNRTVVFSKGGSSGGSGKDLNY